MPRYTLTAEDRCKGGKATAAKYDMKERGRAGLQKLADNHFNGNIKKAGEGLSRLGNFVTDPFPTNGAWRNQRFFELPQTFLATFWGHCEPQFSDDETF